MTDIKAEDYIGIVYCVVGKFLADNPWYRHIEEDLIGLGYLTLVKAINTYDESLSKFSTYSHNRIYFDLQKYARVEASPVRLPRRRLSPSLVTSIEEMRDRGIAEVSSKSTEKTIEHRETARNLVARLSDREKQVIHLRFVQGKTIREAAEVMGISRQAIWNTQKRACDSMRDMYDRECS